MFTNKIKTQIDELLQTTCEKDQIPGMALVIAQHGKPIYENYIGYRNVEQELPVTADTIFGLASITKSLACLAVMHLRDAGKLNIQDKVVDWLPALKLPNEDYTERLQIHHLMSHTSGLPGLPFVHSARSKSIRQDPDGNYLFGKKLPEKTPAIHTVDDLITSISEADFQLLGPPGAVFNYSNEGFALLQKIIELASDTPFIEYIEKNIFAPLGMKASFFRTEDIADHPHVTELYAYTKDKQEVFHSPAWWDVGAIFTNGSLKCSSADLMKYIEVYRLGGTVNGVQIVSQESIREMTAPMVFMPNGGSYGYGIVMDTLQKIELFGHGGSVKGVSSNFLVIKEKDITASVLINMADVASQDILLSSIRTLLELPEEKPTNEKYPLNIEALITFTGRYASAEGHEAKVTISDGTIKVEKDGEITVIFPISEKTFTSAGGVRYTFMTEDDVVTGICIGMRVLEKVVE